MVQIRCHSNSVCGDEIGNDFESFLQDAFVANIALLLGLSSSRVTAVEVTRGSVDAVTIIDPIST